jgi:hypothetical protein
MLGEVKQHNILKFFEDVSEFNKKQGGCFTPYPAVVAVYVPAQVELGFAEENTNKNICSGGDQKRLEATENNSIFFLYKTV